MALTPSVYNDESTKTGLQSMLIKPTVFGPYASMLSLPTNDPASTQSSVDFPGTTSGKVSFVGADTCRATVPVPILKN